METSRILVVEDEPEVLAVIVDVLEEAGYSPRFTTDSREAARLLETADFDVIVSNIFMPYLNGIQVLELAKRKNPGVQVVFVTGHASRDLALEVLEKGASSLLEKPFGNEQLLTAVRQAIWRWQLGRDATQSA